MASDSFGNYIAELPLADQDIRPTTGFVVWGDGAPSGTPSVYQMWYIDETNGVPYINKNGAWTKFSGGGQVIAQNSPEGVVVADPGVTVLAAGSYAI